MIEEVERISQGNDNGLPIHPTDTGGISKVIMSAIMAPRHDLCDTPRRGPYRNANEKHGPDSLFAISFCGYRDCLTGCVGAPHITLSNNVRSELKSVSVSEFVSIPETLFFFGANQAMFGAIGAGLGGLLGETILDDKTVLKNLLKTNNIAVDKMFRAQLETDLKNPDCLTLSTRV